MDPKHRATLTTMLRQDLEVKNVIPKLVEQEILLQEMGEDILKLPNHEDQVQELVRLLQDGGQRAFPVFCDILKEHSPHLAELLTREDRTEMCTSTSSEERSQQIRNGAQDNTSDSACETKSWDTSDISMRVTENNSGNNVPHQVGRISEDRGTRDGTGTKPKTFVQIIKECKVNSGDKPFLTKVFRWFKPTSKPDIPAVRQLSPRELYHLCRNLGATWEQVGLQLGLDQDTLDRCALDNRDSQWGQVHDMLVTWMEVAGVEATVEKLTEALHAAEVPDHLYNCIRVPSLFELSHLAWKLHHTPDWEDTMLGLGLTHNDITHIQTAYPHYRLRQLYQLLLMWREKLGTEATVNRLCEALKNLNETEKFLFLTDPSLRQTTVWDLAQLSQSFSSDWVHITFRLGLTGEDVEWCKEKHPNNISRQLLAALLLWRQNHGVQATVSALACIAPEMDGSLLSPAVPVASVWQLGTVGNKLSPETCDAVCLQLGLTGQMVQTLRQKCGQEPSGFSELSHDGIHNIAALLTWLDMSGDQATLDKLCESLHGEDVAVDIYSFLFDSAEARHPTDLELVQLAVHLSAIPWVTTRLCGPMGFQHHDVLRWERTDPSSTWLQVYTMLDDWRDKVGTEATVVTLCQLLHEGGVSPDKYWFLCQEEPMAFHR